MTTYFKDHLIRKHTRELNEDIDPNQGVISEILKSTLPRMKKNNDLCMDGNHGIPIDVLVVMGDIGIDCFVMEQNRTYL